jgi:hypothetical protein
MKKTILIVSALFLWSPFAAVAQEACEGNFDLDQDVDGVDAALFKDDFGRSFILNPCTTVNPCIGDFSSDGKVDGTDAALFKQDFGRSQFQNPCPECAMENGCSTTAPPSTTVPVTTTMPVPSCNIEIARGRACPGEEIDDPAYNRPGRRGLAATCNDIIDFTVCSDCIPFDPDCLAWTIEPATGFLTIVHIADCCWRLTIDDSCEQLEKIATYTIAVTDTCNGSSDSVEIDIGKVIVDVGDTTIQPETESGLVDISLINPEHAVSAMSLDLAACIPVTGAPANNPDNLTCTQCLVAPDRTGDFTCSASEQVNGSCRVVLYATDPSAAITQGIGAIAQIVYSAGPELDGLCGAEACIDLCAVNIKISDQFNEELCACESPGEVCFRTCGDVYPPDCAGGCGGGTCCGDGVINMYDVLEIDDIILGLQTPTSCQIANGDVPNGTPPYCGNPPGTPNCESDGDIDQFDRKVINDKALGRMNCCDYCLFGKIY